MTDKQKKTWALISSGLMIAFMLPSAVSSYSRGRDVTIGYVGSGKVSGADVAEARAQWDLLKRLTRKVQDPETRSEVEVSFLRDFFARQFGGGQQADQLVERIIAQIDQSREAYYLLVREADDAGTTVSEDEVQNVLKNLVEHPDAESGYEDRLRAAIRSLLMISNTADRAASIVKTSRPERDLLLSRQQLLGLNLVEFKAKDYLATLPQWSETEKVTKLNAQYEKYKNLPPATQPGNEFGFGYQVPNQVQVQYIELRSDDLRKAVSAQIQDKDLWKYYLTNKMDTQPAPFGVKPPLTVAAPPTTQPAATQPALPAVYTERVKSFSEARDEILKRLTDEKMAKLANDMLADINTQLNADYAAFKAATTAGSGPTTATSLPSSSLAKAPPTALGARYDSYEYLQKLALREQDKFGVLPVTHAWNDLRSAKQLADDSSIAKASLAGYDLFTLFQQLRDYRTAAEVSQQLAPFVSFPIYATSFAQPLAGPAIQNLAARYHLRVLALYEPSPVLREGANEIALDPGAGHNIFIFRIAQAVPAHAPPKEDVLEKVLADARLADAYQLARQSASKLVTDSIAQHQHLTSAAAATALGKPVITTGLFDTTSSSVPNYPLPTDPNSFQIFAGNAFTLLGGATRENPHPLGLIDCQPTASVLAAEVNQLVPRWTPDTLASQQLFTTAAFTHQSAAAVRAQWYDVNDLAQRLHYRSADTSKSSRSNQAPNPQQQPEQNPFTP